MPSEGLTMAFGTAHPHTLAAPVDGNANVKTVANATQDPQLARQQQITRILTQTLPQLQSFQKFLLHVFLVV